MDKPRECFLCEKPPVAQRSIMVGVEYDADDSGDHLVGVYSLEWLCDEHVEQYDNREGDFDPQGYE